MKFIGKKFKTFFSVMIPYCIISFLAITAMGASYYQTLGMVKDESINNGLMKLRSMKNEIDSNLLEINNLVYYWAFDKSVREFSAVANNPSEGQDFLKMYDTYLKISSYGKINRFVSNFFIYFKKSDYIIAPNQTAIDVEKYYNSFLKYQNLSYNDWYNLVLNKYHLGDFLPSQSININGKINKYITYMKTIPLDSQSYVSGVIVVLIDEENIIQNLRQEVNASKGCFFITDSSNQLLCSIVNGNMASNDVKLAATNMNGYKEVTIDGIRMIVISERSDYNNWSYYLAYPREYLLSKLNYLRTLYLLTTSTTLLFMLIIASVFAYKNSNRIRKIVDQILSYIGGVGNSKPVNDFDFIGSNIRNLINYNHQLQYDIEQNKPIIKEAFLNRLLKEGFPKDQDIHSFLSYIDLNISACKYAIFLLRINKYSDVFSEDILSEVISAKILAINLLNDKFGTRCHTVKSIDNNIVAAIVTFPTSDYGAYFTSALKQTVEELLSNYGVNTTIAIGRMYTSLGDIKCSYEDAANTMKNTPENYEEKIIYFTDYPLVRQTYYYPINIESRLMNLVKSGEQEEVSSLLDVIYNKNIKERSISNRMMKDLLTQIQGTIENLTDELFPNQTQWPEKVQTAYKAITQKDSLTYQWLKIVEFFQFLCTTVNEKKKSHNKQLCNAIINYIAENYHDSAICLSSIASKFKLSENYLSLFFKEQTGDNFSAYLEKLRMSKACEMMGDRPFEEIALTVGYNSFNTFFKAFKRLYGVSPTTYREINKNMQDKI